MAMSDPRRGTLPDDQPKPDGGYVPLSPPLQRQEEKKALPTPPKKDTKDN